MVHRMSAGATDPAVTLLRMKAERIRQCELAKAGPTLHSLARGKQDEIERMTRSLVENILAWPSSELAKELSPPERQGCARVLCRLFKLEQESREGPVSVTNLQRLLPTERG